MKLEDKQLLLNDIATRLPYGVIADCGFQIRVLNGEDYDFYSECENPICRPFLRPLSSMTDKEKDEYTETFDITSPDVDDYDIFQVRMVDWLVQHHFDVRGLIEKGLALVAPEGMYS